MGLGDNYTGAAAETLAIKRQELSFYLQAEQAFAAGAQSYKIGNREVTRMDPDKLHNIVEKLMQDIIKLQNGGRKSYGIIPRDL